MRCFYVSDELSRNTSAGPPADREELGYDRPGAHHCLNRETLRFQPHEFAEFGEALKEIMSADIKFADFATFVWIHQSYGSYWRSSRHCAPPKHREDPAGGPLGLLCDTTFIRMRLSTELLLQSEITGPLREGRS